MVERIGITKGVNTHTYGYRKCYLSLFDGAD